VSVLSQDAGEPVTVMEEAPSRLIYSGPSKVEFCQRLGAIPLTFFIELSLYKPAPGKPLPVPREWLTERWRERFPNMPEFATVLREQAMILLLDALNEMPRGAGLLRLARRANRRFVSAAEGCRMGGGSPRRGGPPVCLWL
jgi:hypothetical protein